MQDVMKSLIEEKNATKISTLLEKIAEGEIKVDDCTPIIRLLDDRRTAVKQSAIEALKVFNCPKAEEALIGVIKQSTDEYELTYANAALSKIGTKQAVPYLINLLKHPKSNVICSALWALKELGDTSLLPVFLDVLSNRSPEVKTYAMLCINKHGNETAINPVIERVKFLLKRKRNIERNDLILALEFISGFVDEHEEIYNLFDWIKTKKWDFLFNFEKDWITSKI